MLSQRTRDGERHCCKLASQSHRIQGVGVDEREGRYCPVSSAQQALAAAMRATTPYQKAATGRVVDCENGSPGDGRSSLRRSCRYLFRRKARTGRARWPGRRPICVPLIDPHRYIFPGHPPLAIKAPVLEFHEAVAINLASELRGVQRTREHQIAGRSGPGHHGALKRGCVVHPGAHGGHSVFPYCSSPTRSDAPAGFPARCALWRRRSRLRRFWIENNVSA